MSMGISRFYKYIAAGIVSTSFIAVGVCCFQSFMSVHSAFVKPVVETPYRSVAVNSVRFPAKDFVNAFVSESAPNSKGGFVSDLDKRMFPAGCETPAEPVSVVFARSVHNNTYSVRVQAYGSGQAKTHFDSYVKYLNTTCGLKTMVDKANPNIVTYPDGALMTSGDAIVALVYKDNLDDKAKNGLVSWYFDRLKTFLRDSHCKSLNEFSEDSKRSFYYNQGDYNGLISNEIVSVAHSELKPAKFKRFEAGRWNSKIVWGEFNTSLQPPEAPLPKGVNASIPSAPNRPTLSAPPAEPSVDKVIRYQVPDEAGAGCGWDWSGQVKPVFDNASMRTNALNLRNKTKKELLAARSSFEGVLGRWTFNTAQKLPFFNDWDDYRKRAQDTVNSWNTLNNARKRLMPLWDKYVNDLYDWYLQHFRREAAQDAYNTALKPCLAKRISTLKLQYPDLSDDDIEQKARILCRDEVPHDPILGSPEPEKPQEPDYDKDKVTIPESWRSENDVKKLAKERFDENNAENGENSGISGDSTGNSSASNGSNSSNSNNSNSNGGSSTPKKPNNGGSTGNSGDSGNNSSKSGDNFFDRIMQNSGKKAQKR